MRENYVKELLEEQIQQELEAIKNPDISSEEKAGIIDNIDTLYRLKTEETRVEKETLKSRDSYIRLGVDVLAIVAPLVFYGVWMKRGLKYEETGSFTSQTFKGLISCFKPKK